MLKKQFGLESKPQNTRFKLDTQLERNLKGKELESQGKLEEAKELYLQNMNEGFEGNHPYDRLAIMFRKEQAYDKEIEVLEKAIYVFENKVNKQRMDRQPKLERFKKRLKDVKKKISQ